MQNSKAENKQIKCSKKANQ